MIIIFQRHRMRSRSQCAGLGGGVTANGAEPLLTTCVEAQLRQRDDTGQYEVQRAFEVVIEIAAEPEGTGRLHRHKSMQKCSHSARGGKRARRADDTTDGVDRRCHRILSPLQRGGSAEGIWCEHARVELR